MNPAEQVTAYVCLTLAVTAAWLVLRLLMATIRRYFGEPECPSPARYVSDGAVAARLERERTEQAALDSLPAEEDDTYAGEGFLLGAFLGHPFLGLWYGSLLRKPKGGAGA